MEGEQARMVFTDPPNDIPTDDHAGDPGKTRRRDFAMASEEMNGDEFKGFLQSAFERLIEHSVDGSIHYVCMDWRRMAEVLAAGKAVFDELKNLIVWAKDDGRMGAFYRSRHELIFAFKHGTAPHINTFEHGRNGRCRTDVWRYRGADTMPAGLMEELAPHPTVKPVRMIADAIRDVSGRGEIVLDVFGGSGSTLIAAEKTGRRARLCELDPLYCDRILARWQAYAKDEAERLVCGRPVEARRQEAAL